jgi:putative ABC transport system substrate-binding protein
MRLGILALAVTLPAAPLAVEAQPPARAHVVGVLTPHREHAQWPAFFETLGQLGYEEGRNLRLVIRSADAKLDRLPGLAVDLVRAKVDVVVAVNTPASRAAIGATKDIPIVMAAVGDPVASGLVTNLARPGGNVTGISNVGAELAGKRLSLLKEAVPMARRIAVITNPEDPVTAPQIKETGRTAPSLGVEVRFFPVRAAGELPPAFEGMLKWQANAALWLQGGATAYQAPTIELATKHRLPLMVLQRPHVEAGGLLSYFPDHFELFRRVAVYVDQILKGAKPSDLPVEQPTKFELVINMKTARALGLTIPPSLLLRTDHVIE